MKNTRLFPITKDKDAEWKPQNINTSIISNQTAHDYRYAYNAAKEIRPIAGRKLVAYTVESREGRRVTFHLFALVIRFDFDSIPFDCHSAAIRRRTTVESQL